VGKSAFEEAYAVLEVAENEFVLVGWTNSFGQGHYDFYVAKVSVENDSDWLSAYNFVVLALIMTAIVLVVLVVLFFLIRRYINQKISRQNVNAV
jgi:heme exporter protein D